MAIIRWTGQAGARRELRYYVPKNVAPGAGYQLSDGLSKNIAIYPSIQPEVDVDQVAMAERIVNQIVAQSFSVSDRLGGGAGAVFTLSAATYEGMPAIKALGPEDGRPVSLVASATSSSDNPILVSQLQAGSSGANAVFTLTWPVTPTAGTWAIAADGKKPIILEYNVSAADLRLAILTLGIPCADVTVTGSHSAGYTVTLVSPTEKIAEPPLLFPIVPPTSGGAQTFSATFIEPYTYQFGAPGYTAGFFEANISAAALKTLIIGIIGIEHEDFISIAMFKLPPEAQPAGVTCRITFTSNAARTAFLAMQKSFYTYAWNDFASHSSALGVSTFTTPAATSDRMKIRMDIQTRTEFGETINPLFRQWHTTSFVNPTGPAIAYQFNTPPAGYDTQLTVARTTNFGSSISSATLTAIITASFTSDGGLPWVLDYASGHMNFFRGVMVNTPNAFNFSEDFSGDSNSGVLGVNNNAGWTVSTVSQPGIINHEVLVTGIEFSKNFNYRFETATKKSHLFPGFSSLAIIEKAAESLWGVGNVKLSRTSEGMRVLFVGNLSETEVTFSVVEVGGGNVTTTVAVSASTPMQSWKLRYQFTGGVCAGRWRFEKNADVWFDWLNTSEPTSVAIRNAILGIDVSYTTLISVNDIDVVTEAVGNQFLLREFTITFQAQPKMPPGVVAEVPFWFALVTQELLTAEPTLSVKSLGRVVAKEIQSVALENKPTTGNWTLTYNAVTTSSLAYNATPEDVRLALVAISQDVSVVGANGGPYMIKWNTNGERFLLIGNDVTLNSTGTPTFDMVIGVVGTGPKHWNNQDNWSPRTIPTVADTAVFSDGSIDCSFGTTGLQSPAQIDIYRSYLGNIGLPEIREDGAMETLPAWLDFTSSAGIGSMIIGSSFAVGGTTTIVRVGLGNSGEGPAIIRMDFGNKAFDGLLLFSQSGLRNPCLGLRGNHSDNKLVAIKGDVALGVRPEDVTYLKSLQMTPSTASGDDLVVSSSSSTTIARVNALGGVANFGKPPISMTAINTEITVNGVGNCKYLDAGNTRVRWIANGTLGVGAIPTGLLFGVLLNQTSTVTPTGVRVVSNNHGLTSGDRVYMRAYSGVVGIDGKVFSIQVVDSNHFDLLGAQATGTLVGYVGQVAWALEKQVLIRADAILDFDSDGQTRDIVAPILLFGNARVLDSKLSVGDLRLWPEQVEALASFGHGIELRRTSR